MTNSAIKTPGYTIRRGEGAEDREAIVSLWTENLADDDRGRRFDLLYSGNPFGRSPFWLAKDASDKDVGGTGLIVRPFSINGRQAKGAVAADFAVRKEHRAFGPALALQRRLVDALGTEGIAIACGFPNPQAERVLRRAGFFEAGRAGRFVKLLATGEKLEKYIRLQAVNRAVSAVADTVLRASSKERSYKRPNGVRAGETSSFGPSFDRLWDRAKGAFPITGERTSAYLNWRYAGFAGKYRTLAIESGPETRGFVVYALEGRTARVYDIVSADLDASFDAVMGEFVAHIKGNGGSSISILYLGSGRFIERLKEWNFMRREDENPFVAALPAGAEVSFFRDPSNWHVFEGDDI